VNFVFRIVLVYLILQPFSIGAQEVCNESENKKARKLFNEASSKVKSNRNEAKQLLLEALKLDEDYAQAALLYAQILIKSKKVKQAEPYLKIVDKNCPNLDPKIHYYLGGIALEDKQYAEARRHYATFLESKSGTSVENEETRNLIQQAIFFENGYKNRVPFDPLPLKDISTPADEYLPIITPDNKAAYFTRRTLERTLNSVTSEPKYVERFSYSLLKSDKTYEVGLPMPEPFNKSFNEGGASLSADNRLMCFTICKNEGGPLLNCDIYFTTFQNDKWTEIRNAGPDVNGKETWESQPSLSSDGKTMYFSSNRPGGFGELDIWRSTRRADGTWSEPENLGASINTAGSEKSPFFHSDGQTLYFSSTGHPGFGGFDIYFSKLDKEIGWQTPKNIGYPINSEKDDLGFFVSTDGKTGYFASDKFEGVGGWDVYAFPLYKEARPERVLFLSGEVSDENNKRVTDTKLEIKNLKTREITTIDVDSATGKYVAVVAFNEDHIITVKKEGKAFQSQYFSTADSTLNEPGKVDLKVEDIKVGKGYRLNNVNFETNSALLTEETLFIIEEFSVFLHENPTVEVAIHGHTDNVGDASTNLELSTQRARTVYDFLILEGIEAKRIRFKGFGASKPLTTNATEVGRAKNRRTEFVITKN